MNFVPSFSRNYLFLENNDHMLLTSFVILGKIEIFCSYVIKITLFQDHFAYNSINNLLKIVSFNLDNRFEIKIKMIDTLIRIF